MGIKCQKCGEIYYLDSAICPLCGADNSNSNIDFSNESNPKTIEELKQWYANHNLPPKQVTRFFIGENYTGAKAFGIYKDEGTGNVIVYKNKSDASRAIRYQGTDEQYAVNQILTKLKEEILNQKSNNPIKENEYTGSSRSLGNKRKRGLKFNNLTLILIIFAIQLIPMIFSFIFSINQPKRGYYYYLDSYYYYQNGSWYEYDNRRGWGIAYGVDDLRKNYSTYYRSSSNIYGIDSFENSTYYVEPSTYSSSDSSSSWSSDDYSWSSDDSWDSGSTDWDSDW